MWTDCTHGDERLDVAVSRITAITRSQASKWIENGQVMVNDIVITKPSLKPKALATLCITPPTLAPLEAEAENIPLTFYYEDADIAVVEKPCGMVVHPAPGNETGTLVNALLYHIKDLSGIGGVMRPGIVHRLDKDTSGLLLVAKTDEAHVQLSHQLKQRQIDKRYLAVVEGHMREPNGFIDKPIARSKKDRKQMTIDPNGRPSQTEWEVLDTLRNASLLSVHIITGRTHQIRVHMKSIHHPVAGDVIYGAKNGVKVNRLMLHAHRLQFVHPRTQQTLHFTSEPPSEFSRNVQRC